MAEEVELQRHVPILNIVWRLWACLILTTTSILINNEYTPYMYRMTAILRVLLKDLQTDVGDGSTLYNEDTERVSTDSNRLDEGS